MESLRTDKLAAETDSRITRPKREGSVEIARFYVVALAMGISNGEYE